MTTLLNQISEFKSLNKDNFDLQLRINNANNVIEINHVINKVAGGFKQAWNAFESILKTNGVKFIVLHDCTKNENDTWASYGFAGSKRDSKLRFKCLEKDFDNEDTRVTIAFDLVRSGMLEPINMDFFKRCTNDFNLELLKEYKEVIESIDAIAWEQL